MPLSTPIHQRGVAALVVTMTLFFAMLLVAVFANRNLVFEQRSSANQYRATQAFEAAEAGLEWAQAQLNSVQRIGADCKASADTGAASFRARYLRTAAATAGFTSNVWSNAGVETALQPSCVHAAAGWQCSCPANGHPQLVAPADGQAAPAFTLQFLPGTKPGVVRVVARGCSSLAGVCAPGATTTADATARVEVALALLPGLASAPGATLTARGAVNAAGAAMGIHNPDVASGGVAVHAGAGIDVGAAHLSGPAGASRATVMVGNDTTLQALSADQLFIAYFGHDRTSWASQPVVTSLTCSGSCGVALENAVASAGSNALIRVSGNLSLEGPVTIGTPAQPVIVVVDGAAQLRGPVTLYGLLYASAVSWNGPIPSGALLRGALVSETGYQGDGTPELVYDAPILDALRTRTGTLARVSGSWRDF
jgi:PilX N-terminal